MLSTLQKKERIFGLFLVIPTLLFVAVLGIYPIGYSFYLSFQRIILGLPGLGRTFVGLQNYIDLFHDRVALHAIGNTLIFVFVSTLFEIILGLLIALVIHQQFAGRGPVRAAVLVPWAIPTVVASQMWRFLFNDKYGLVNLAFFGHDIAHYKAWLADPFFAFCAIILADIWKTSSFAALLILAGLQTIPDELYEAAKIDGANQWQRFTGITLPLLKPAILIALLFRTMDAFRVFDLVFVMTQGGPADATNVIQFYGYKKIFAEGLMGYGSTVSVLIFLITLAIALFYIKTLGSGIMQEKT